MSRRLFVAVPPPEATRQRLLAAVGGLRQALGAAARPLRWLDPAAWHLTLRFLGDVEEGAIEALAGAVEGAAGAGRPLELAVRGAGAFPSAHRARALFLGVEGEVAPLRELVVDLEARLGAIGLPPEQRVFHPHLTVARARGERGARGLESALSAAATAPIPWVARALVLFESHLEPGGARHVPLRVAPLGGLR